MHVGYQGTNGTRSVYLCNTRQIHYGEPACQRIPGKAVDQWVVDHLMKALTPAQIELSLAIVAELERQQTELLRQRQRQLEAAQYTAGLAQRRYELVDPANRLVARTLEQRWEASLQEVSRLETDLVTFSRQQAPTLTAEQRQSLLQLAADLPTVWFAPTTTWTERKDLLELFIADVTLTRHETGITVQIRWFTNEVETGQLPLPISGGGKPTPTALVERIRALSVTHIDKEVAEILNREGIKTSREHAFTAKSVEMTRRRNGIVKHVIQP